QSSLPCFIYSTHHTFESTTRFFPEKFRDNNEKYKVLSKNIEERFGFCYSFSTLESNAQSFDIRDKDKVIKILKDFGYKKVATKYDNDIRRK
ncbi:hypothetical protein, partial [Emticicia fontis]